MSYVFFIFLGFCLGVLSGCFGVGGAFVLTPTLNVLGFPMVTAVGTGLVFSAGVSLLGGMRNLKAGLISIKAVARFVLPLSLISLFALTLAKSIVINLEISNKSDMYIRSAYVILLFWSGFTVIIQKNNKNNFFRKILQNNIPPYINIDIENKMISVWSILFIGVFIGFLQGFMGVGGGFMLVPLLISICGLSAHRVVGVSLLVILISSIYGGFLYIGAKKVEILPAIVMIVSSWGGVLIGQKINVNFNEKTLRFYLGFFLICCGFGVTLRHLGWQKLSLFYMLFLSFVSTLYILVRGYGALYREKSHLS